MMCWESRVQTNVKSSLILQVEVQSVATEHLHKSITTKCSNPVDNFLICTLLKPYPAWKLFSAFALPQCNSKHLKLWYSSLGGHPLPAGHILAGAHWLRSPWQSCFHTPLSPLSAPTASREWHQQEKSTVTVMQPEWWLKLYFKTPLHRKLHVGSRLSHFRYLC